LLSRSNCIGQLPHFIAPIWWGRVGLPPPVEVVGSGVGVGGVAANRWGRWGGSGLSGQNPKVSEAQGITRDPESVADLVARLGVSVAVYRLLVGGGVGSGGRVGGEIRDS